MQEELSKGKYSSYICPMLIENGDIVQYEEGTLEDDFAIIYTQCKRIVFEDDEYIIEELVNSFSYYVKCIKYLKGIK